MLSDQPDATSICSSRSVSADGQARKAVHIVVGEIPRVSILITTRDRSEALVRCLESVLCSDYPALEVLILDDFSQELAVCDLVNSTFDDHRIVCFRSERQLGVSGARNLLMRRAQGDILIVIDDDAVLKAANAIPRAVDLLSTNPKAGMLAFRIITAQDGQLSLWTPFSRLTRRRQPDIHNREQLVSYYLGTAHALRRELIECCGTYQDDFFFGEEELDLSYRAISAGYEILYVPTIIAHHYPRPSVVEMDECGGSLTELELHVRNRIWLVYKHLPLPFLLTNASVWLAFYALQAVRNGLPSAYVRGILRGVAGLGHLRRRPLCKEAIAYLKRNHGRLWY